MSLANHLTTLEASGLIRLAAMDPELEYLFRHALVQEAAYASLVKADRKQLHLAVGEALESLYPEQAASRELAPILGEHFTKAGDDERALKYLTLAGDAAARVYANAEAALHYARALDIAKRTIAAPDSHLRLPSAREAGREGGAEVLIHLYTSYGQALELTIRHADALANYAEMETLAQRRGDRAMEFAAVMARAKIYSTPHQFHNPAGAKPLLQRALALAQDLGDQAIQSKILWNLMLLQVFAGGDPRQTVAYGEQSLAIARALDLREQMAFTLNDIAYAYVLTNQSDASLAALTEARGLWHELGNLPMLSDNLANTSIRQFASGDYDQALASAAESFHISQSIGNQWGQASSQLVVGQIHMDRGEPDNAIASIEAAVRLGEPIGHSFALFMQADLGWLYGMLGRIEWGLETAQQVYQRALKDPLPIARLGPLAALARLQVLKGDLVAAHNLVQEGYVSYDPAIQLLFSHRALALADGELALAQKDYERALAVMNKLLAELGRSQTRPFVPDALYIASQALLALGRPTEANAALHTARAKAEAMTSRRMLWPILISLGEIAARQGNGAQAEALREAARVIVQYIADHTSSAKLHGAFLALPSVRAVLH
jgi:tetratricopeptide (TPR) repeat protein